MEEINLGYKAGDISVPEEDPPEGKLDPAMAARPAKDSIPLTPPPDLSKNEVSDLNCGGVSRKEIKTPKKKKGHIIIDINFRCPHKDFKSFNKSISYSLVSELSVKLVFSFIFS